jgi:hypothetical protein
MHFQKLFEEALQDSKRNGPRARVGEREIRVVALHYLVALKLASDRPQDEVDLQALLAKEALDYPRAREIVERHLGHFAARRLDRLARLVRRADAPADYDDGYA